MPSKLAKRIADAAEMIVDGYAVLNDELGCKIVNLNSGHAVIVSPKYKVLASSMDAIEEKIAIHNLEDNLEFMVA